MNILKKFFTRVCIDGLSGMALGLFSTLIVGTIIQQLGLLIGGHIGQCAYYIGRMAASVTGAGIGVGVAYKFKESPLVTLSAATCGMVGAFATKILAGATILDGATTLAGPGEPLGAFIAAYIGIEIGRIFSGKTQIDIVLTPLISVVSGSAAGLLVGPSISKFMNQIGEMINWGAEQKPLLVGIVVSVLMGMALTLPISSAALGVILNLSGVAAGAATVGCCANMVGFAVASFRENKFGGLLAQGLGTSMLQVPNIVKNPLIWLPSIITSAILGPVATCSLIQMTNNATGSGMGTAGLVGQIMTYQDMAPKRGSVTTIILIVLLHFILPGLLSLLISEFMRKKKWIKEGDMKLDI
ncbi:MAG TPA: PTS sugar transporter subunit IIC [Lachnospiraceae bacterium]|nr:PTS sugar transporter subunit IIC [uncultured Lachnoclostridium sp.]HAU86442.1 PTS sugar transporter subunit IIC [Lachnospiraceae bacterium]